MAQALIASAFLLSVTIAGGALPQYVKLNDRKLHLLLALGTGMLIGTIFYHMLPEALEGPGATFVIVGLLGVFVIERLIFQPHEHNEEREHHHHTPDEDADCDRSGHSIIGSTALVGLSVHAAMVGLGLSVGLREGNAGGTLLASLVIHKFSEAFSLSTIFMLAGYSQARSLKLLALFSVIEPGALVLGQLFITMLPGTWESAAAGLSGGTFLYVALCDLLPEVFHRREGRWTALAALSVGVAFIGGVIMFGGRT